MKITLITITLAVCVFAKVQPGDTLTSFFWFQNEGDSTIQGCESYLIIEESEGNILNSTFWMTKYQWWQKMFPDVNIKFDIFINDTTPNSVTQHCSNFNNAQWTERIKHNNDSINFVFPVIDNQYGRYDYYTVSVNDTMGINFYGAGDSIMVGTFVHKEPDSIGAINILARNAIIVELTNSNSTRIKSIRFNWQFKAQLTEYLKYDFETFKSDADWYGVTITDTSYVEPYVKEIVVCDSTVYDTSHVVITKDSTIVVVKDSTKIDTTYYIDTTFQIIYDTNTTVITIYDTTFYFDTTFVVVNDTNVVNVFDTTIVLDTVRVTINDTIIHVDTTVICTYIDSMTVFDTVKIFDTIPYFKVDSLPSGFYIRNFGMFKNPKITIQEE